MTGYAPTIVASSNSSFGIGSILIDGKIVTAGVSVSSDLGLGNLIISGYAPEVTDGTIFVRLGLGSLSLSGKEMHPGAYKSRRFVMVG
jgi:hypothetical protein